MKRIVILMSVYNGGKYLEEQLLSIIQQDIRKIEGYSVELCIRIDGSVDDSEELIECFADKIPINLYVEDNIGPAKSFWRLLSLAPEADYYAFADQDDFWFSDKLRRAIVCINNSNAKIPQLYCSAVEVVDKDLKPIATKTTPKFTDFPHALICSLTVGCTFVFNREALLKAKEYDINANFVEMHDWLLHKIISMVGSVHYKKSLTFPERFARIPLADKSIRTIGAAGSASA